MGIAINLCIRDTYMVRDTYFVVNKWALPFSNHIDDVTFSNHIDDVTLHKQVAASIFVYKYVRMYACYTVIVKSTLVFITGA